MLQFYYCFRHKNNEKGKNSWKNRNSWPRTKENHSWKAVGGQFWETSFPTSLWPHGKNIQSLVNSTFTKSASLKCTVLILTFSPAVRDRNSMFKLQQVIVLHCAPVPSKHYISWWPLSWKLLSASNHLSLLNLDQWHMVFFIFI